MPGGRCKRGIKAGTAAQSREDKFGQVVPNSATEDYIDRVMGCLAQGPDLLERWKKEHRKEGKHRG